MYKNISFARVFEVTGRNSVLSCFCSHLVGPSRVLSIILILIMTKVVMFRYNLGGTMANCFGVFVQGLKQLH